MILEDFENLDQASDLLGPSLKNSETGIPIWEHEGWQIVYLPYNQFDAGRGYQGFYGRPIDAPYLQWSDIGDYTSLLKMIKGHNAAR